MVARFAFALVLACASTAVFAHGLHYEVANAQSIVVTLYEPDDSPFAFEPYEIRSKGQDSPLQTGRTDARGRIAFVAPAPGSYEVRATSEDGHGLVFEIDAAAGSVLTGAERPVFERYQRTLVGLGILLGIFGAISLFYRRRHR